MCVELKPKCGTLPSPSFIPSDRIALSRCCRFCLHKRQRLKLGNLLPRYCPLKLFSGDTTKMEEALEALVDQPSNNMRVFIGSATSPVNQLTSEMILVLVRILTQEPLLDTLLQIQRLDRYGVYGTHQLYTRLLEGHCPSQLSALVESLTASASLQALQLAQEECWVEDAGNTHLLLLPPEKMMNAVSLWLLALAAKDCSLIIPFRKVRSFKAQTPQSSTTQGCVCGPGGLGVAERWMYRVWVVDFGRKPLHKLEAQKKLEEEIFLFNSREGLSWSCLDTNGPDTR